MNLQLKNHKLVQLQGDVNNISTVVLREKPGTAQIDTESKAGYINRGFVAFWKQDIFENNLVTSHFLSKQFHWKILS